MTLDEIICTDALEGLKQLDSESIDCVVTSPPYWGLRNYGTGKWEGGNPDCDHSKRTSNKHESSTLQSRATNSNHEKEGWKGGVCGKCGAKQVDKQLGLEKTPEEYVAKMVEVFREVRRVLKKEGTCWLNIGDSYAGSGGEHKEDGKNDAGFQGNIRHGVQKKYNLPNLKPKDLCGIPWRVAFALQLDGWWLRQDIIWSKPNPMPESVLDRCTKSHEYVFLLTKSKKYFYDNEAIKEPARNWGDRDRTNWKARRIPGQKPNTGGEKGNFEESGRNKRSVWIVNTKASPPSDNLHFAKFPEALIEPIVKAGTSEKGVCPDCGKPWIRVVESKPMVIKRSERTHEFGRTRSSGSVVEFNECKTVGWKPVCSCNKQPIPATVLDPFMGSGTTAVVARKLGRHFIGFDLNQEYVDMATKRVKPFLEQRMLGEYGGQE